MSEETPARIDDSDERQVSIRTEAVAGLTTFFTMAYIVVVNPLVLSTEGTGMPFGGVLTATVLVCFTVYALALVAVGLLMIQHA